MRSFNSILIVCILVLGAGCAGVKKTATTIVKAPVVIVKKAAHMIVKTPEAIIHAPETIVETGKVIWGSSTKALENARVDAISRTYQCSYDACFDAVLDLERIRDTGYIPDEEDAEKNDDDDEDVFAKKEIRVIKDGFFDVFIKNRVKGHIVVMGVAGSVETTEVGIFFSEPGDEAAVKIEVTSLSSSAKRRIAEIIFDALALRFPEVS